MSKGTRDSEIQMLDIEDIHILNPRVRNKKVFQEIKENIARMGLKRPITVTRSQGEPEKPYDLVCGQGRLEAFVALGQSKIPAIVIDADEEEALVMSLVENLARRQRSSLDLLKGIEMLLNKKYNYVEIAQKTGLSPEYVNEIIKLIERGEERLISAVEAGKIPMNIAVKIALSPGNEQHALQEAYENNELRGKRLLNARKLIEARRLRGKAVRGGGRSRRGKRQENLSGRDIVMAHQKEVDRKRSVTRKAEFVQTQLLFVVEALHRLYAEDHFATLLKAENLTTLPQPIAEMLKNKDKRYG